MELLSIEEALRQVRQRRAVVLKRMAARNPRNDSPEIIEKLNHH
jgi:hypothetical protein